MRLDRIYSVIDPEVITDPVVIIIWPQKWEQNTSCAEHIFLAQSWQHKTSQTLKKLKNIFLILQNGKVSYADQSCICLIKNTLRAVHCEILLQSKSTVFFVNIL